jgi:hypothetical protein
MRMTCVIGKALLNKLSDKNCETAEHLGSDNALHDAITLQKLLNLRLTKPTTAPLYTKSKAPVAHN